MRPVLAAYERALLEVRRQAGGARPVLRVGYLISAAQWMLAPALESLRKSHPDLQIKLHDLSPREQLDALRAGQLDIALIGQEGAMAVSDFHSRKLCSIGVCAALSESDALASRESVTLSELHGHAFIGIDEHQMPGRNRWMSALCRTAKFKPRFVTTADGITNVLSQVVSESAVTLVPAYMKSFASPGVRYVPVSDPAARWDFIVLWQRGRIPEATLALLAALSKVES